ncbi:hypothetical protein J6590_103158 [Homalodisca vitripennis]|nr:hypothetical protein J6590_103158 [Homalodisca vitripennis]
MYKKVFFDNVFYTENKPAILPYRFISPRLCFWSRVAKLMFYVNINDQETPAVMPQSLT